jgi:hypothetical protein
MVVRITWPPLTPPLLSAGISGTGRNSPFDVASTLIGTGPLISFAMTLCLSVVAAGRPAGTVLMPAFGPERKLAVSARYLRGKARRQMEVPLENEKGPRKGPLTPH